MKIYNLAFLLLFQYPFASPITDSLQKLNKNKSGVANIVFKSADGGQTWQDISKGLPENLEEGGFFANESGLYLRAGNGIYHSKPNSTAPFWNKEISPDKLGNIAPGNTGIYAYNYGGQILQKANGTNVWSPVFTNFQKKEIRTVFETAGGSVFIGSDNGLFRSTNSGKTWKQVQAGGWAMKLVESNGILLATSQRGIIRSADEGENWTLVISEGGVGIDVERIEGGFAAITYSTVSKTRRIRTSYDGGKTWQAIDAGLQASGFIDPILPPVNANLPVQGFSDSTWHPKDTMSLAVPTYITTIIQVGENFFCGHTDGIYRSSDKGKTWKLVLPSVKGKMFKVSVSGNVIYAIQMESHC
jgi:photosystem II stability/assembly factor-like uncharacterized protein